MQEDKGRGSDLDRRRERVERIKKTIRWARAVLIILPMILSLILLGQVLSLNKNMHVLEEKVESIIESSQHLDQTSLDESALLDNINEELVEENANLSSQDELISGTEDVEEELISVDPIRTIEDVLSSSTKKVYLTFDDGPSLNTTEILDILAEYDVKATFFVVGREEEEYLDLYKRIVDEGHTIGIHSYSHVYSEIYASPEAYLEDIWKISDYIYDLTGVRSDFYRFPGGSSTTKMHGKLDLFKECLESCDLKYYDWNASANDSGVVLATKDEIVNNVINDLGYNESTIILFHDAFEKQSTVDALPEIIEYIQGMENTVILPISEGTELIHQK